VSVCFSKGLGAPAGSALCGAKALIERARRWRKVLGGGMRQVGMLAAAAQYALDHHVHRLAEDHALAAQLAQGLSGIPDITVRSAQTNMVFVEVAEDRGPALAAYLATQGVLATGRKGLRLVTHLDVDAQGVAHTIACVKNFFAQSAAGTAASIRAGAY